MKPHQNRTGRLCKMCSRKIGTLTIRIGFFFCLGGGLSYTINIIRNPPPQKKKKPILIIKALTIPRLLKAAGASEDPWVKGLRVSGLYGFGLGFRV